MVDILSAVEPSVVRIHYLYDVETWAEPQIWKLGTGFIFSVDEDEAYVLTNFHVVEVGQTDPPLVQLRVVASDGTEYEAHFVGAYSKHDVAVLRICCGDFGVVPLADNSDLAVGQNVVNIGYQLGLGGQATVTRGIISAIRWDAELGVNVIQTDAALNPGGSGGPMLSHEGEVLGINTYIIRETEGIGFALNIGDVEPLLEPMRTCSLNRETEYGIFAKSILEYIDGVENALENNEGGYRLTAEREAMDELVQFLGDLSIPEIEQRDELREVVNAIQLHVKDIPYWYTLSGLYSLYRGRGPIDSIEGEMRRNWEEARNHADSLHKPTPKVCDLSII